MVGPSKILTVSYGTFSCTLEGFDDPFSTMRGIAEYFRDLAADDRYFGAEPPTPDAEMLHRIAEREIHRRVEARVDDNGITLRQLDDQKESAVDPVSASADSVQAPVAAAAVFAEQDTNVQPEETDEAVANAPVEDAEPATAPPIAVAPASTESVAEKLARIRLAVSGQSDADKGYVEDQHADEMFATAPISAAFQDIDEETNDEPAELYQAAPAVHGDDQEFEADDLDAPVTDTVDAFDIVEFDKAEDEQTLIDEVSEPFTDRHVSEPDDLVADPAEDMDLVELPDFDSAGDLDVSPAVPESKPDEIAVSEESPVDDVVLADDDADDVVSEEGAEAEAEADAEAIENFFSQSSAPSADEYEEDDADNVAEPFSDQALTLGQEDAAPNSLVDDLAEPDTTEEDIAASSDADASTDKPERSFVGAAIARVIKMRRSEFDEALEDGEIEEVETAPTIEDVDMDAPEVDLAEAEIEPDTEVETNVEVESEVEVEVEAESETETEARAFADEHDDDEGDEDDPEMQMFDDEGSEETVEFADDDLGEDLDDSADEHATPAVASGENGLSDEEEADLMATLEQVQRENDAESRADQEGRALLENQDLEDNGESVDRILEVTNNEMQETEGSRRRSAIAHLKAAVLATRADKKLSKEQDESEDPTELNQYRDDLARVVRPRRPVASESGSERRMAPLVLVSEQRVDDEEKDSAQDAIAGTVVPRRVRSDDSTETADDQDDRFAADDAAGDAMFGDSSSFSEFADKMGATELPDLLEAAAAYASYVEGRPHFSRPQIMKAVLNFNESQEFTREESLRSFGQLLRRGKIQKLKRGQFTISQNTRFNPEARAAGE